MPPVATCHDGACRWLDLAVGYRDLGYSPVPLGPEKRPLVKWGALAADVPGMPVLYSWWPDPLKAARGLAFVAGKGTGLVVLDADDADAWEWALERLPATRGVRTSRGGHLHYRHPDRGLVGCRSGKGAILLEGRRYDVKGTGGMATAPYSIHPSGHVYEPVGDWTTPVSSLPVLPAEIEKLAQDRPPSRWTAPPPLKESTDPVKSFGQYLAKAGGLPPTGKGSDEAVFRAASWAKANLPGLTLGQFVHCIRSERPEFQEAWIAVKWKSARGK